MNRTFLSWRKEVVASRRAEFYTYTLFFCMSRGNFVFSVFIAPRTEFLCTSWVAHFEWSLKGFVFVPEGRIPSVLIRCGFEEQDDIIRSIKKKKRKALGAALWHVHHHFLHSANLSHEFSLIKILSVYGDTETPPLAPSSMACDRKGQVSGTWGFSSYTHLVDKTEGPQAGTSSQFRNHYRECHWSRWIRCSLATFFPVP